MRLGSGGHDSTTEAGASFTAVPESFNYSHLLRSTLEEGKKAQRNVKR